MAAERLSARGHHVTLYDRMASPARKFLMAGRGGLNLTHSEPWADFVTRYRPAGEPQLEAALSAWPADAVTSWAHGLGIETFTGSSGRVFPRVMKASPLLRAWLSRLREQGVRVQVRHDWTGFARDGRLTFMADGQSVAIAPDATLLALGGASWPRLGSNGAWTTILADHGIEVRPLAASNCGVKIPWSAPFLTRFKGAPLKRVAVSIAGHSARGELVVTADGLEGGAVYALSAPIRDALRTGQASLAIDLRPDMSAEDLTRRLDVPKGKQSMATYLRKAVSLSPVAIALLREPGPLPAEPKGLAARIKRVDCPLAGVCGLERAISTAGGLPFASLDANFMLRSRPGVFAAGEMLDWDAPTGGYLLQAVLATGVAAADGITRWLQYPPTDRKPVPFNARL